MKPTKISYAFSIFLALATQPALADTVYVWNVEIKDEFSKTNVEGAQVFFEITDGRSDKKTTESCTTNNNGECQVSATAYSNFFTPYSRLNTIYRIHKDGYKETFKTSTLQLNENTQLLRIYVESLAHAEEQEKRASAEIDKKKQMAADLIKAQSDAIVYCQNKEQCDKAFSLTEIYIAKASDMKIQTTTNNIIESHDPIEPYQVGASAYRIPGKGTTSTITFKANCKDTANSIEPSVECLRKTLTVVAGFRPFIESMLKE